jgi:putative ABC transport system substrate-binding protein
MKPYSKTIKVKVVFLLALIVITLLAVGCAQTPQKQVYRVGVLLSGDIRLEPLAGLKEGLAELGYVEGDTIILDIYNAGGDRAKLPELAQTIVDSRPDLAVASGGIEADALKAATEGSSLPVVFLAVASAVERGLVASMRSSGNNLTGIDTNDTQLTAKRLEWMTRIAPEARRILILNVPSITPSAQAAQVAKETAADLGLDLTVVDVETGEDIQQAASEIAADTVDAILILPAAPVWQAMKEVLYPAAVAQSIPIFGVNRQDLDNGAVASYAASRYLSGKQAARLVDKILRGTLPGDLPVETPDKLEFVINRTLADKLRLQISDQVWDLADEVVQVNIQ